VNPLWSRLLALAAVGSISGCADTVEIQLLFTAEECARFCAADAALQVVDAANGETVVDLTRACGQGTLDATLEVGRSYDVRIQLLGALGVQVEGETTYAPTAVDGPQAALGDIVMDYANGFAPTLDAVEPGTDQPVWVFPVGRQMTLTGSGFGSDTAWVVALREGERVADLTVESWTDDQVVATMPHGVNADSVALERCGAVSEAVAIDLRSVQIRSVTDVLSGATDICERPVFTGFDPLGLGAELPAGVQEGVGFGVNCLDASGGCASEGWWGYIDRDTCGLIGVAPVSPETEPDAPELGCIEDTRVSGRKWSALVRGPKEVVFGELGKDTKSRSALPYQRLVQDPPVFVALGRDEEGEEIWPIGQATGFFPGFVGQDPILDLGDHLAASRSADGVTLTTPILGGFTKSCTVSDCQADGPEAATVIGGLEDDFGTWRAAAGALICHERVFVVRWGEDRECVPDDQIVELALEDSPKDETTLHVDQARGAVWTVSSTRAVAYDWRSGQALGAWSAPEGVAGASKRGAPLRDGSYWVAGPGAVVTVIDSGAPLCGATRAISAWEVSAL